MHHTNLKPKNLNLILESKSNLFIDYFYFSGDPFDLQSLNNLSKKCRLDISIIANNNKQFFVPDFYSINYQNIDYYTFDNILVYSSKRN